MSSQLPAQKGELPVNEYTVRYQGKVIVGAFAIADLQHALQIKAAIDSDEAGIEVTVVEELKPPKPRAMPKVGYWMIHKDGEDKLSLQTSESPYGGWSFENEGYDSSCRLFPDKGGLSESVLVYATSSGEAVTMALELRRIYAEQRESEEESNS